MRVTVGRIVHFYPRLEGETVVGPFAAVVSRVFDAETGCCNLHVFMDGAVPILLKTSILRSASGAPEAGRWCWPPREE